ncbi:hypothetical protein [Flaviaesturariibacter terrae]
MKKLLSYKHWQLFLLVAVCGAWTSPSPLKEIVNSVAVITFTLWIYAIGVYGQERIAALGLKPMNLRLFKTNVVVTGSFFLLGLAFSIIQGEVDPATTDTIDLADIIYIAGGFYVVFAMLQATLFACKTLAKLEYKREVTFGDYFNNLLLVFFFFVGVWFLQPKVNRLIATKEEVAY